MEEAYTLKVKKENPKRNKHKLNFQEIKIPQGPIVPLFIVQSILLRKKRSVLALCLQPAKKIFLLAGCKHIFWR